MGKRQAVQYILDHHDFSIQRACGLVGLSRSSWYYRCQRNDSDVMVLLDKLSIERPEEGFWKLYGRIRSAGLVWNHKRVHRIYKLMGLNLKPKRKRRLPNRVKEPLFVPEGLNETWSGDFVHDVLSNGSRFWVFTMVDDYNRECLALEVGVSLPAARIARVLDRVIEVRGKPKQIRVDNGPEFISKAFSQWAAGHGIKILFIEPGKPSQNGYVERFNRTYRTGVLDAYIFDSMQQVRQLSEVWRMDYNYHRPHDSLGRIAPLRYAAVENSG